MFGLPSLQIYGLQSDPSGTKVTSHFLEKFTKSEFYVDSNNTKDAFITANNNTNNNNSNNNNNNNNTNHNNNNNSNNYNNNNNSDSAQDKDSAHSVTFPGGGIRGVGGGEVDSGEGKKRINAVEENSNQPITETNASDLNKRLSTAEVNLVMQRKKYAKVISFLNQHNLHLEKELAIEKRRRAEELSKIIKSLLCFEAKLKNEKKVINQKLYQRDTEICRLVSLNKVLKQKLGAGVGAGNCGTDIQNDCDVDDALMCPSCRKQFYGIDRSEVWTQTFDDERSAKDDYTEYASSSDETLSSSFCGARRSIRYTSKRTFGTFQDYMRSRSMSIDDHNYDNSEENASTLSREESHNGYEKMNGFSRKIDRLHGIRRIDSFVIDDTGTDSGNESHRKNGGNVTNNKRKNNRKHNRNPDDEEETYLMTENHKTNKVRIKEFAETSPKHDFETSTDDWYASASDVEDSDSVRAKPYGYNAVNPVLECVNQILLQQSMDESLMDGPPSLESSENNSGSGGSHKDTTSSSRKRVHFSTKNSMVHVPRDDDRSSPSPPTIMGSDQKDNNFNYESIYSNEYEPIGSERNSSNHYVDMESKLGQEDHIMVQEKPKQPPALPPKPANLMKFKRVLRINPTQTLNLKNVEQQKIDERTESEPDYCSISEVSEVVKSVQIVADVHKSADDDISSISSNHSDAVSNKTDDVEEIFADIPKLPNVAAIIVPKTVGKFIANDNYITKSPTKEDGSPKKSHHVPNILAEINKKKAIASNQNTPTKAHVHPMSPSKVNSTPIKIHTEDKLPLQAEFDWYNLDAEYGKSNQPDVIKETDVTNSETDSDEHQHNNVGVEYNLDEEFCLSNQPDIIKENILEPKICPTATICDDFPTIVEHSPSNNHNETTPTEKVQKSFKDFIDNSGLSTKPLPRQRKIYFSGPFV